MPVLSKHLLLALCCAATFETRQKSYLLWSLAAHRLSHAAFKSTQEHTPASENLETLVWDDACLLNVAWRPAMLVRLAPTSIVPQNGPMLAMGLWFVLFLCELQTFCHPPVTSRAVLSWTTRSIKFDQSIEFRVTRGFRHRARKAPWRYEAFYVADLGCRLWGNGLSKHHIVTWSLRGHGPCSCG